MSDKMEFYEIQNQKMLNSYDTSLFQGIYIFI